MARIIYRFHYLTQGLQREGLAYEVLNRTFCSIARHHPCPMTCLADYGARVKSMLGAADTVKSIDIMILRANTVRTDKTNCFLAQSRSSDVL